MVQQNSQPLLNTLVWAHLSLPQNTCCSWLRKSWLGTQLVKYIAV